MYEDRTAYALETDQTGRTFLPGRGAQMKHAYLILAHGKMELLPLLLRCIDDSRNDIYIHVDRKTPIIPSFHTEKAALVILEDRVDVYWGDVSMLEAELNLFESALSSGKHYAYFHLLSGVDLPLKTQDEIHQFCDAHQGKEFIGYSQTTETAEIERNMHLWHPFHKHLQSKNIFIRVIRGFILQTQKMLHLRKNNNIRFFKGAQWVSVTEAMARLFVSRKDWITETFSHTLCSDEIVMQTLCWNSPLKDNIFSLDSEWSGNLRKIGWSNGHLTDWSAGNYEELAASNALFARKFNGSDPQFLDRILSLSLPSGKE